MRQKHITKNYLRNIMELENEVLKNFGYYGGAVGDAAVQLNS